MGLAGPKKRNKIGSDPNNTKWSKATDRFGHKILTSQGWKPGDTLGQKDASHSSHYTAGSSSHIRVMLREDNLGLGAKNGRQDADTFGLDMFQGLLGRLNGKSEDVLAKEDGYRRDLRLKEVVVKKFGGITFVSAGYLVGDKIEREIGSVRTEGTDDTGADVSVSGKAQDKSGSSKKRKRAGESRTELKSTKKSKTTSAVEDVEASAKEDERKKDKKESKKQKTRRKHETTTSPEDSNAADIADADSTSAAQMAAIVPQKLDEKAQKKLRKAQRRAEKEAKRLAKEEKKRRKSERREGTVAEAQDETKDGQSPISDEVSATERATLVESIPNGVVYAAVEKAPVPTTTTTAAAAAAAATAALRGRNLVRSRFQRSKRMAVTDEKALREIFMIKVQA